jgi:hypothetical protein
MRLLKPLGSSHQGARHFAHVGHHRLEGRRGQQGRGNEEGHGEKQIEFGALTTPRTKRFNSAAKVEVTTFVHNISRIIFE